MTAVIRYVTHTMDGGDNTPAVDSTGSDYQLVAFDITTTVGVAQGADLQVLVWEGAGTIKSILSVKILNIATGDIIPTGAAFVDPTGKFIEIAVQEEGTAIPANSLISLTLVIGNY